MLALEEIDITGPSKRVVPWLHEFQREQEVISRNLGITFFAGSRSTRPKRGIKKQRKVGEHFENTTEVEKRLVNLVK